MQISTESLYLHSRPSSVLISSALSDYDYLNFTSKSSNSRNIFCSNIFGILLCCAVFANIDYNAVRTELWRCGRNVPATFLLKSRNAPIWLDETEFKNFSNLQALRLDLKTFFAVVNLAI